METRQIGSLATDQGPEGHSELDSHVDTCIVGDNTALVIQDFECPVSVVGYDRTVGAAKNYKTVSAVIAYDHPRTGQAFMLILHQAILIPKMHCNLLGTMQTRANDIRVNDEPKFMAPNPTEDHNAIVIPETTPRDGEVKLRIPLSIHGAITYFPCRKPTLNEFQGTDPEFCINLTYEEPEWDPTTTMFADQEEAMLDSSGNLRDDSTSRARQQSKMVAAVYFSQDQDWDDMNFAIVLSSLCIIKEEESSRLVAALSTGKRAFKIGPALLAKHWNIGLERAKRTLEATTQKGVRTVVDSHLSRWYKTNDRQLRYRRLSHPLFTDTLEASVQSWFRQNRYAQVFASQLGWVWVYPMKKKSKAHEALSLLAQRDGVPPVIIMDGAKEQTMGEFRRKAREMGVHIRQTEPYSPWQNAAEGAI